MPPEDVRQFVTALGKGQPSRAIAQVFDEAGAFAFRNGVISQAKS
jgi:hypothetical protein